MDVDFYTKHEDSLVLLDIINDLIMRNNILVDNKTEKGLSMLLMKHKNLFAKETGLRFDSFHYKLGIYYFKIVDEKKLILTKLKYGI